MRRSCIFQSGWPSLDPESPISIVRNGVQYEAKSMREAARLSGIPHSTFRRAARAGLIPASWGIEVRMGRVWLKVQRNIGRFCRLTVYFEDGKELEYESYAEFAGYYRQTSGAISRAFSDDRGTVPLKFTGVLWMDNGVRRIYSIRGPT
jgi:hypothetical protein